MPLDAAGQQFIKNLQEAMQSARGLNNQFLDMVRAGQKGAAIELLMQKANPENEKWHGLVQDFMNLQESKDKQDEVTANQTYEFSRNLIIGFTVGAIFLSIFIAYYISSTIIQQLGCEPQYAAEVANRIATGDLTGEIRVRENDQRSLIYAIQVMQQNLSQIVQQVNKGTISIASASQQIAVGNMDLSSRTERQASSLEETAASLEELTSTVRHNAENAGMANKLAASASAVAAKGGDMVQQVVQNMEAINESSRKIEDIISVIDDIAFQTNILALNAAVEAARAGEQGRGFAVVASEVRNLAQRSATAAKEIKELISDSTEKVSGGSKLVDLAGNAILDVVASVNRVSEVINEITSASQEQSSGIEQINLAIIHMDDVTQQNAAMVEEAAAAASAMDEQAKALANLIAVFKINTSFALEDSGNISQGSRSKIHPYQTKADVAEKSRVRLIPN
ncbi:methyl-accepting chemotaxis protein [Undibacterium sp. FT31W]|uniref:Methyl-accepting chemotaxis protein n=2 Tax=Undibacterium griseum TaxID=2762295 RepID=A0ABR6YLI6_9BURK|nr:methyl-accepting chemotaxis protein [Undibacterium griseum]